MVLSLELARSGFHPSAKEQPVAKPEATVVNEIVSFLQGERQEQVVLPFSTYADDEIIALTAKPKCEVPSVFSERIGKLAEQNPNLAPSATLFEAKQVENQ